MNSGELRYKRFVSPYRGFNLYSLQSGGPCFWGEIAFPSGAIHRTEPTEALAAVKADIIDYWDLQRCPHCGAIHSVAGDS